MEPNFRGHRARLSFEVVGSQDSGVNEEKPPIILLHGMAAAKEFWKNIMHPIAKATGRKVYAYDARNHGDSSWSDEFNMEVMEEDLTQFMDDLHMQKAVLIGHCMGGNVAMCFSAKWPERVEKLIVEDISPKPLSEPLRSQVKMYGQMLVRITGRIPESITELEDAKNFLCKMLRDITPEDHRSSRHRALDGSAIPLIQDENRKYKWKTNLAIVNDFLIKSCSPPLIPGTYDGPALFIYGTMSPYKVANDREYILNRFPGARFRAVEGAAHRIHLEFDDVFVGEVEHFLNEL